MTGNFKVVLVIWALAISSLSNAFNVFVPKNKELIYDYKSTVSAGIELPAPFASQLLLQGKLHLQSDDNVTWVKLTDLKHHTYNGKLNEKELKYAEYAELPKEMHELMEPFKVIHDQEGKAIGIIINKQEKEFIRNMKRALASVLQIEVNQVKNVKYPRSFITSEHTIYGPQMAHYTVLPQLNKMVMVQKVYELTHDHMWYFDNREPSLCDVEYKDPVTQNSQRQYLISTADENVVQFMTAFGGIFYTSFDGKSSGHNILANQTMILVDQISVGQHWEIKHEHFEGLMYQYMYVNEQLESIADLTNGRKQVNVETMMPKVVKLLHELTEYLDNDHLQLHTPNYKQGQVVGVIKSMLAELTLNEMKKLHTIIKQQSNPELREVFYEMVPLVGTTASTLFIKYLLLNYQDERILLVWLTNMLNEMSLNIKVPTRQLLSEMAEIIDWEKNVQANLYGTAVMAFGTLVYRNLRFEVGHKHLMSTEHIRDMHIEEDNQKKQEQELRKEIKEYHEKYAERIINKMLQSNDTEYHIIYMSALYNMRLPIVAKYISQAMGQQWWPNHYKVHFIWTLTPMMMEDPELAYKILWPLIINRNEHAEVRIVAYYLMMEAHPSIGRLANIFWFMQDEPCHELYNFHYSYVKNMAQSQNPCYYKIKENCARFLPYMRPSDHGTSMVSMTDFSDNIYGFGKAVQVVMIQTNDSLCMMFYLKSNLINRGYDDELFYIQISGVNYFGDMVKFNTNADKNMLLAEDAVMTLYNSLKNNSNAHIIMVRIKQDFVVTSAFITLAELPDYKAFVKIFSLHELFDTKNIEMKHISISYENYMKTMMPTDSGIPAIRSFMIPAVEKIKTNVRMNNNNDTFNMHIGHQYIQWVYGKHGLEFYNPIMDVYQTIHEVHAFDASYPVSMDVTFNMDQKNMNISLMRHQNEKGDRFGIRSHVSTRITVVGVGEDSMNESAYDYMVTNGDEYKHNYSIMNKEDMMTGTHWEIIIFDTEDHVSNGTWKDFMYDIVDTRTKNFQNPLDYVALVFMNCHEKLLMQPRVGAHGILLRMDPVHDHDVKSIDLVLRWDFEIKIGDYLYRPGMKLNNRMTYSLKSTEKTLKTWDVDTTWELNAGHTNSKLKMDFARIIPGQKDYHICLRGTKKMTDRDVSANLNVGLSQTKDGKCPLDHAVVDITMTGMRSHDQESERHMYGTCEYAMPHFMQRYNTLQCLTEYSTVRRYIYDIKLLNLPTEFQKYITSICDAIKSYYFRYYNLADDHNVPVKENNIKMEIIYPMYNDKVDLSIYTPHQMHQITGLPTYFYKWFGIYPDNLKYPPMFVIWHYLGLVDRCKVTVDKDHVDMWFNDHFDEKSLSNDWTMYIGDVIDHPRQAVYMKKDNDDQMAIKMVHESNTMEVHPVQDHTNEYTVTINGKPMPQGQTEIIENWVTYHQITTLEGSPVILTMPHPGIHIEFHHNATEIKMIMPKVDHGWKGRCQKHH